MVDLTECVMSDYKANKNYAEIMRGGADLARDQRDEEMQDRIEKERKAIAALPDLIEALKAARHALELNFHLVTTPEERMNSVKGESAIAKALKKAGVE
jgi:hypothetical protein